MFLPVYDATRLQLAMDLRVDLGTRAIVRGNNQCVLRRSRVLTSNRCDSVFPPFYFMHSPLLVEAFDCGGYALIVSLKSPKNPELYNGTVRAYSNILVALKPRVRITL